MFRFPRAFALSALSVSVALGLAACGSDTSSGPATDAAAAAAVVTDAPPPRRPPQTRAVG